MLSKKKKTWVVIADGARARFLKHEGPKSDIKPFHEEDNPDGRKLTRHQGTDKPGRQSPRHAGGTRPQQQGLPNPVDWQEFAKETFARDLARQINHAAKQNNFDRLILAAPAKTLGELRSHLDKDVADKVDGELNKDLTNFKLHELREHLSDFLIIRKPARMDPRGPEMGKVG